MSVTLPGGPAAGQLAPECPGRSAGQLAQEFLALVCADDELLRAEFEEIIAAGWDNPPSRPRPERGDDRRPGPGAPPVPAGDEEQPRTSRRTRGAAGGRQRSPPAAPPVTG
jgi:hypothetical protein